jgi:molybdopterin-guanine dinucleotide biosynthesis protein A
MNKLLGVVLAGGQSRRIGKDKTFTPCDQVWVSGDRHQGLGPLGGLANILSQLPAQDGFTHLIVVPVDMPRLQPVLLQAFLQALLKSVEDADAAVFQNFSLPLVCRISRRLNETLDSLCAPQVPSRHRSLKTLISCLQTRELSAPIDWQSHLRHFNTPDDLLERAA